MSHHLIEARDLGFAYPDGTVALEGVSFRVVHGESVALIGGNGAGKSTLLHHFVGALLPSSGELRVGDVPLLPSTLGEIRRAVGFLFENADDQLFLPLVRDDVAFGPRNLGLPEGEATSRVDRALEEAGAAHLAARSPHRLSTGEKKRVALAGVLALAPDILALDEPTSGLDPAARRRLIGLLAGFAHTKIIATHDLDLALDLCPRTIVLSRGRVVADGPSGRILADAPLLASCGLEPPLSQQGCPVCRAARRNGAPA